MAFWNRTKNAPTPTPTPNQAQAPAQPTAGHTHAAAPSAQVPAGTPAMAPATNGPAALAGVKHVIAIASGKGGVGKSTVTANLAVALRYAGNSVGLLDADLYGPSQPGMLGARDLKGGTTETGTLLPVERNGIRFLSMGLFMPGDGPLVWRAPMAMKAIQQFLTGAEWGALDYLLIDLPPGTGDVQLTLAQQARLAGAVIVTTPQEVALGIAKKGLEMFKSLNIPILGIIENMSGFECGHCHETTAIFKEGGGKELARRLGVPFLGALPLDPEIMLSGDEGKPVLDQGTTSKAAQAILGIANRLDQETRASATEKNVVEPTSFGLMSSGSLMIEWPESEGVAAKASSYDAFTLRVNCGCASCVDENTGRPLLDPARVPAEVRMLNVQGVGRYALTISFSDGHSTGIYPFKKLRALDGVRAERPVSGATAAGGAASPAGAREKIEAFLEAKVNPSVAGHGGKIELVSLDGPRVTLLMSGGCQGCGAAKVTLRDGVERALRAEFPWITEVVDSTDHNAGTKPYYAREAMAKGHSHSHESGGHVHGPGCNH